MGRVLLFDLGGPSSLEEEKKLIFPLVPSFLSPLVSGAHQLRELSNRTFHAKYVNEHHERAKPNVGGTTDAGGYRLLSEVLFAFCLCQRPNKIIQSYLFST